MKGTYRWQTSWSSYSKYPQLSYQLISISYQPYFFQPANLQEGCCPSTRGLLKFFRPSTTINYPLMIEHHRSKSLPLVLVLPQKPATWEMCSSQFSGWTYKKTVLNPKDCTAKCFNKQFMPQVADICQLASNMAMLSHDDILTWKLIDITFKVTVNCQYTLVREMSNNFS